MPNRIAPAALPVPVEPGAIPAQLRHAADSARRYREGRYADGTRAIYAANWRRFEKWTRELGFNSLPAHPGMVASVLAEQADRGIAASTVTQYASAIAHAHWLADLPSPLTGPVKEVLRGIRRKAGGVKRRKHPITAEIVAAMLAHQRPGLVGMRDAALLVVGFAAALRRSELVALNVQDIEFSRKGMVITVRRSKTDQEGHGQTVAVPLGTHLQPVRALRRWLVEARIKSGPLFRPLHRAGGALPDRLTRQSVALIVKWYADACGFEAVEFSGHSLRAGFVTSALEAGADYSRIMSVTRHKQMDEIATYDRRVGGFKDHPGAKFL